MKPTEILACATAPDGSPVTLARRDGVYTLSIDGQELMSSRQSGSERDLARLGCAAIADRPAPHVLVGGLGFGYTLRAALDLLPAAARIVVCELFGFLIEAHRGEVGALAGRPLDDPRVEVVPADLRTVVDGRERFDALLLDVDNGPWAFTIPSNAEIYSDAGLARLRRSLTAGGILAIWSAEPAPEFEARLRRAGFTARTERVPPRPGTKRRHAIFLARPTV